MEDYVNDIARSSGLAERIKVEGLKWIGIMYFLHPPLHPFLKNIS